MKESKNLGITKACPECRKILIKAANIIGCGSFKTKCPHCGSLVLIEVGQKTFITIGKVLATFLILVVVGFQILSLTGINAKLVYLLDTISFEPKP